MAAEDNTSHRLLHLFYEVAFLDGRRRAGMTLSVDEEDRLGLLISALGGDPGWVRRRFRRKGLLLSAIIKGVCGVARASVLNMSPGGMLLVAELDAEPGESVLVKFGRPGAVQYSFPCRVERVGRHGDAQHLALAVTGIPLEVRYGGGQRESQPQTRIIRRTA